MSTNETPKTGIELIADERQRQVTQEGWTPEHDDGHSTEELVDAAALYLETGSKYGHNLTDVVWPWNQSSFKPGTRVRNLVKAGALIAAEIDRLQRTQRREVQP